MTSQVSAPSIVRVSDGAVIASHVETADTFMSRLTGLLGRSRMDEREALVIRPCNNVHMFFMRMPIDVLFCDESDRIVRVVSNLRPWRVSPIVSGSRYVIELAAGRAAALALKEGDQIRIG